jgi:hypothetical protein
MLPSITHPTDRPNFTEFQVGDLTIWYSYQTPIAYRVWSSGTGIVVRENDWGPTTGRHCSFLDNGRPRSSRVPGEIFDHDLALICDGLRFSDPLAEAI